MGPSTNVYGVKLARQMNAVSESADNEESLDFAQALNTALCFLCWINADVGVAEEFLTRWPEALLLEGTNQDCASCIVKQRKRQCSCNTQNLEALLRVISRGFLYYKHKHMNDLLGTGVGDEDQSVKVVELRSTSVFPKLMSTGRHLRNLSVEECAVHSQMAEAHVAKVLLERKLHETKALAKRKMSRVGALFACGSERIKELQDRVARLEHSVQMAELKLASVEREHGLLVNAIDQGHRIQYALLKDAFEGCARHSCIHSEATSHVEEVGV